MKELIEKRIEEHLRALGNSRHLNQKIEQVAKALSKALSKGKKILICGNGGSAADAQHLSAELLGKFEKIRRPFAAIALTTDTSIITAWSNDDSFDNIFARQVHGLGAKGDFLIAFSTSGNSPNIIKAVNQAKKMGLATVSFLGKGGGKMRGMCDFELVVNHKVTAHIQEVHQIYYHILCALLDREVLN